MTDLARVEKLIEKATPGPWDFWNVAFVRIPSTQRPDYDDQVYGFEPTHDREQAIPDAAFIAHMRQLAPLMLLVCKRAAELDLSEWPRLSEPLAALDAYIAENLEVK